MVKRELNICKECGNEYYEDLPMCPNCTKHYNEVYGYNLKDIKPKNEFVIKNTNKRSYTKIIIISIFLVFIFIFVPMSFNYIISLNNTEITNAVHTNTVNTVNVVNQEPKSNPLVINSDIDLEWIEHRLVFKGLINNESNDVINGAQITIALFDDNEVILDTASDFIDYIPEKGTWEFKINFYNVEENATRYRIINLIAND